MGCITELDAATRTRAAALEKWLGQNKARVLGEASTRNKIAMQYALQNPEFTSALAGLLASKGLPQHLISERQAAIINAIASLSLDSGDFARGNYYLGTLHVINTVSGTMLTLLVPWGATATDVVNVSGSFATAYVYGYFWGV
jgi:hypothetical protein